MFFVSTLTCVAIMLLYSVPAFLVVKGRLVRQEAISAFATVLMYICQPCLTVYTFTRVDFSAKLAIDFSIFCLLVLVILGVFLALFYVLFHKKYTDERYRIYTIATSFSNCTFMGLPLLEKLFPDNPEIVMFSIAFFLSMTLICWTFGSFIITGDKRFISLRKMLLNPGMISVYVSLPLWILGVKLPGMLEECMGLLGKMTTPMCMIVLGMRLATVSIKEVFCNSKQYLVVALNQFLLPLLAVAMVYFLPLDTQLKQSFVILCATPVASVVLNFAEMLGKGQHTAANCVLLGTMGSLLSLPMVSLLLPLL